MSTRRRNTADAPRPRPQSGPGIGTPSKSGSQSGSQSGSRSQGRSGRGATALAVAAQRVTGRDRWLLRMLHEHTVLTTTHLHQLGFAPTRRAGLDRLQQLHELEITHRFRPLRSHGSAPLHHVLGPLGAQILAAEYGVDLPALGYRADRALAVAHRITLAHDVATTSLVCQLAAARDLQLHAWWSPARCRRLLGDHVRPDTYLQLATRASATPPAGAAGAADSPPGGPGTGRAAVGPTTGTRGRRWEMFIEYDTGTTALRPLAAKLRGYAALAEALGVVVPVGVWIARPGREPGARQALTAAHRALLRPQLVPVLTAAPPPPVATPASDGPAEPGGQTVRAESGEDHPDDAAGAAGPVWLPLRRLPGTPARRYHLTDLAALAHLLGCDPRHPSLTAATEYRPHDADDLTADGLGEYEVGGDGADGPLVAGGRVELPAPPPVLRW